MNFLFSAIPTLFSSPTVRNVIGGLAGSAWNAIKQRGQEAITNLANDAIVAKNNYVQNNIIPAINNRVIPALEDDDYLQQYIPRRPPGRRPPPVEDIAEYWEDERPVRRMKPKPRKRVRT